MTDYQVMPELDDDEFSRLKEDIAENGIEYPIIVDGDGNIIDGHHRKQAWEELGRDPDELPTRVVDESDTDNYHRAYRANLLRRDLTDGTKKKVVKQYLLEHPERVQEDSLREIASDLGVSLGTVQNAKQEAEKERGNPFKPEQFTTDEKKQQVRAYLNQNPDASNRKVAREVECDVTHVTVGNWRNEWGDTEERSTGLDTFTNTKEEAEQAIEVAKEAKEGDETAEKEVEKLSKGDTTPSDAKQTVEKEQRIKQSRKEKEEKEKERLKSYNEETDKYEVIHGDFTEVDIEDESVDHIITDPPYGQDHIEVWEQLSAFADRVLKPGGFCIAYAGKYHLPKVINGLNTHLVYYWQAVVTHESGNPGIPQRKLRTGYKPILIFSKPPVESQEEFTNDVISGEGREKDKHEWQQAEAEAVELLERFTNTNDIVCDPMAGSGTTLAACQETNRKGIAIDKDREAIETILERIE